MDTVNIDFSSEIGQLVYVFTKDIFVRVIDKEFIEGVQLFYTDNNSCYIEEQLHSSKSSWPVLYLDVLFA